MKNKTVKEKKKMNKRLIKLWKDAYNLEQTITSEFLKKWYGKKHTITVLKKMPKANISYTCCNIEVSEPKGSEVLCPECKEYCQTKGESFLTGNPREEDDLDQNG